MSILSFEGNHPLIADRVFIAESSVIIGQTVIGEDSSVWPGVVIRGDIHRIQIGKRTSIQDNSVIHVTHDSSYHPGGFATTVGDEVIVGHRVLLHGCVIQDRCLVGMGSIVMDGAVIESDVILAAGSLVPPGKVLNSGFLWMGSPAKAIRELKQSEYAEIVYSAKHYVKLKERYLNNQRD